MRTTAIFNLKGGVGKTVTTVNLAAELAARDKHIVVIDADAQHNATDFLIGCSDIAFMLSLKDVLTGSLELEPRGALYNTNLESVRLLPSDEDLALADLAAMQQGRMHADALQKLCSRLAEESCVDHVLIDCPPSFSAATVAALRAADDVIIPLKIDAFSVKGVATIMRQIREMQEINPRLRVDGVLLTMVDLRTKVSKEGIRLLDEAKIPRYEAYIRRSTLVDASTFFCTPLRVSVPRSQPAEDYARFAEEYLRGGAGNG